MLSVSPSAAVQENRPDSLREHLHFELSHPVDYRLEVPLDVVEGTARSGEQFTISGTPRAIFEPGAIQGHLSGVGESSDIQLIDDLLDESDVPRQFTVRVRPIADLIDVDESRSACVISVVDDEKPSILGTAIRFAGEGREVRESQALGIRLAVTAEAAVAEETSFTISALCRKHDRVTELGRKPFVLPAGEVAQELPVWEIVDPVRWNAAGLADDDAPGPPSEISFRLTATHPLQPTAPRELTFRVLDDDPAARVVIRVVDGDGASLERVLPETPFWVEADFDRRVRVDVPLRVSLESGGAASGVLNEGLRKAKVGPLTVANNDRRSVELLFEALSQGNADRFVQPSTTTLRLPQGPKDPAKYAIVVVNGSRVGEPGNGIIDAARKAIKGIPSRPFQDGVVLVGPSSTILLEDDHWEAPLDLAFLPLVQEAHGVDSQLNRIVEVVNRIRSECEDPGIRLVVIWPERELAFVDAETMMRKLRDLEIGPVSFLCPGVGYEMAPAQAAALRRGDDRVTFRSPGINELPEHVRFAVQGYPLPQGQQ
jgi:hypothetical protein